MILLEAMLAGVPVAATPVGGVPALVTPATGWLAAGTSVPAIRQAVADAFAAPAQASSRAAHAAGGIGVERFQQYVEAHRSLYSTVLAGQGS